MRKEKGSIKESVLVSGGSDSHCPDYSVVKWLGVRFARAADQQKGMKN